MHMHKARSFSVAFRPRAPVVPRRVVVTGLGLVSPLGTGVQRSWDRLIKGESGTVTIEDPTILKHNLPSRVAAPVKRGSNEGEFDAAQWVPRSLSSTASPFVQFALSASTQALQDSGWSPTSEKEKDRAGVCIGSGTGSVEDIYQAGDILHQQGQRRVGVFTLPRFLINLAAGQVSIHHQLRGPNHAASTACTTGAHALADAARLIAYDEADVMVAGASEAAVTPISVSLFSKIRALSTNFNDTPSQASRPFDTKRDGFVIGEGAGVMVLEELSHALARGAKIYAEVMGWGYSGDAFHVTQPESTGYGAQLSMRSALRNAGLSPSDIGYVNAHATSTPLGDSIEAGAIWRVFGREEAPESSGSTSSSTAPLLVSSTKGATGHMLGAAGAAEAIFSVLSLHHNMVPGTLNLEEKDAACLAYPTEEGSSSSVSSSSSSSSRSVEFLSQPRQVELNAVMSNSFGFGGTNASLIFGKFRP